MEKKIYTFYRELPTGRKTIVTYVDDVCVCAIYVTPQGDIRECKHKPKVHWSDLLLLYDYHSVV